MGAYNAKLLVKQDQKAAKMQRTGFAASSSFVATRGGKDSFSGTRTSMERSAADRLNMKFTLKETEYKGSSRRERIETNKLRMPKIVNNHELLQARPILQRRIPQHRYSCAAEIDPSQLYR